MSKAEVPVFLNPNIDFSDQIVLVVDDEEPYRMFISKVVEKYLKAKTVTASNPKDAFELLLDIKPALIFLDMQMPLMDGQTALRYIRANEKTSDIPVIVCTALSNATLLFNLAKLGISDYIVKPSDPRTIIEKAYKAITKYLEKQNTESESES